MSTPQACPTLETRDHVRPPLVLRSTPPWSQLVAKATELRSREHARPGISEPAVVSWSVKAVEPLVARQCTPWSKPVTPSPTRITELSLSGTTTMSHGLRNTVVEYALQVLPRSIERNSESLSTPKYIVSGRSGSTSSGIPYWPK